MGTYRHSGVRGRGGGGGAGLKEGAARRRVAVAAQERLEKDQQGNRAGRSLGDGGGVVRVVAGCRGRDPVDGEGDDAEGAVDVGEVHERREREVQGAGAVRLKGLRAAAVSGGFTPRCGSNTAAPARREMQPTRGHIAAGRRRQLGD
jgi:hypothetical protein